MMVSVAGARSPLALGEEPTSGAQAAGQRGGIGIVIQRQGRKFQELVIRDHDGFNAVWACWAVELTRWKSCGNRERLGKVVK